MVREDLADHRVWVRGVLEDRLIWDRPQGRDRLVNLCRQEEEALHHEAHLQDHRAPQAHMVDPRALMVDHHIADHRPHIKEGPRLITEGRHTTKGPLGLTRGLLDPTRGLLQTKGHLLVCRVDHRECEGLILGILVALLRDLVGLLALVSGIPRRLIINNFSLALGNGIDHHNHFSLGQVDLHQEGQDQDPDLDLDPDPCHPMIPTEAVDQTGTGLHQVTTVDPHQVAQEVLHQVHPLQDNLEVPHPRDSLVVPHPQEDSHPLVSLHPKVCHLQEALQEVRHHQECKVLPMDRPTDHPHRDPWDLLLIVALQISLLVRPHMEDHLIKDPLMGDHPRIIADRHNSMEDRHNSTEAHPHMEGHRHMEGLPNNTGDHPHMAVLAHITCLHTADHLPRMVVPLMGHPHPIADLLRPTKVGHPLVTVGPQHHMSTRHFSSRVRALRHHRVLRQ